MNKAAIAAVARDDRGTIVDGANAVVNSCSALVAEALAIRLGCSLAARRKWSKVIIESDCKELIDRLHGNHHSGCWLTSAVEGDVTDMKNSFAFCSFMFVCKKANCVADRVARKTRTRECPLIWFACPPGELLAML